MSPGLIDFGATTGLAYATGTGLQFQSEIGTADLIVEPGEAGSGEVLMESAGYILLEDGFSYIALE